MLEAGYLRGADLWHVAHALYVTPCPASLSFVTLDARQGAVAEALGFPVVGDTAGSWASGGDQLVATPGEPNPGVERRGCP